MADLLYICEICGVVLDESQCKARCPNCGRMMDCADLAILPSNGKVEEDSEGQKVLVPLPTTPIARHANVEGQN